MKIISNWKRWRNNWEVRGNRYNVNVENSREGFSGIKKAETGISSLTQDRIEKKRKKEDRVGVGKKLPENKNEFFKI